MSPTVDRSLIVLISGWIVSFAVMKGWVAPENATALSQQIEIFVGGLIAAAAIIGYFTHKTSVQNYQTAKLENATALLQSNQVQQTNQPTAPVAPAPGAGTPDQPATPAVTTAPTTAPVTVPAAPVATAA